MASSPNGRPARAFLPPGECVWGRNAAESGRGAACTRPLRTPGRVPPRPAPPHPAALPRGKAGLTDRVLVAAVLARQHLHSAGLQLDRLFHWKKEDRPVSGAEAEATGRCSSARTGLLAGTASPPRRGEGAAVGGGGGRHTECGSSRGGDAGLPDSAGVS